MPPDPKKKSVESPVSAFCYVLATAGNYAQGPDREEERSEDCVLQQTTGSCVEKSEDCVLHQRISFLHDAHVLMTQM